MREKKKRFYTEIAYVIGLVTLALGTSLMVKANFGVSMVVAPAYLLNLKMSEYFSFVTFGMAEYVLQAVLLIVMVLILRKFKLSYLFSFITAVIYGFVLDGITMIVSLAPDLFGIRILFFIVGMLFSSLGVCMMFHTYISAEAYEMFVKELSEHFGIKIHNFKTAYDCVSLLVSVVMSFAFFGMFNFVGINIGTLICTLINGRIIGLFSYLLNKNFTFSDATNMRKYFK